MKYPKYVLLQFHIYIQKYKTFGRLGKLNIILEKLNFLHYIIKLLSEINNNYKFLNYVSLKTTCCFRIYLTNEPIWMVCCAAGMLHKNCIPKQTKKKKNLGLCENKN